MKQNEDDWAVFWCSLLGEILLDEVPAGERRRYLKNLSQKVVTLPNGRRKQISLSTLRRKVRQFRKQRIAGLKRKPRTDRGSIRKDRRAVLNRAIELKREQPRRSPRAINQILAHEFGRTIPKATLNRHFRQAGVTRKKLADPQPVIRCRWTREQANALWVGDFSEGPKVFHHGQAVKSHLSIWIDCHSRYVIEGRYYFRENLDILLDSLLRAWGSHGASRELYVDNAKVYHSGALKLAAAELNIHLRHRPPRDPSPGGIIERVIQTTQHQFEAEVRAGDVLTLDELNGYFQAWLHADYHQAVHSATGQTPLERFEASTRFRRHVKLSDVLEFFHVQVRRKVDEEFCDVRINNLYFAVDAKLRGDRVIVVYDPFSTMEEVRLKSLHGKFLGTGRRYHRERGTHPQPPRDSQSPTPLDHSYLKLLEEKHRRQQQEEAAAGIDYHQAQQRHLWSFSSFAATFARLLGRRGGVSALGTHEMELLSQVHNRYPRITRRLLEEAFERAEPKTMVVIVFHLQNLLQENERLMYHEHFKLKRQPFSEHAAADSLWIDERMNEGLARLAYLVEGGSLGLVTGPTGVGKSALLKRFLSDLPQRCEAAYCHLTHLRSSGVLKSLVTQLGEVPRLGKDRLFEQILGAARRVEGTLLVVMDEAHLLDGEALTDLRLLISSAVDVAPPLKLLLVGQHTLRATLKRSQHADLLNRINVHYQLRALSKEGTGRYLDIQMHQAGGEEDVFDAEVKGLIHDFTGGIPRQINNLATACLLGAAGSGVLRIDTTLFQRTVSEFQLT